MAQKFIITKEGHFRLGDVRLHKDLLEKGDVCYGGGFYQFDYLNGRLKLDGESMDFGAPHWDWLAIDETTLKVPEAYRGLQMAYHPGDHLAEDIVIANLLKVEYV